MTVKILNYGGGTNSTALAIWAVNAGIPLDAVVFADTGSERPETMKYVSLFSDWLVKHGQPPVTTVRWIRKRGPWAGRFIPLHEWCEHFKSLPSRAFGMSGCTQKWKQYPADSYVKSHPTVVKEHESGRPVERWIGYDADEPSRFERMKRKNPDPHLWVWRSPLVENDIGRAECIDLIQSAGLPMPGKSACWLCPSMKKVEIDALQREHPSLLSRALNIETEAFKAGNVRSRGGLGGSLNWGEYIKEKCRPKQTRLFNDPDISGACGCFDGG